MRRCRQLAHRSAHVCDRRSSPRPSRSGHSSSRRAARHESSAPLADACAAADARAAGQTPTATATTRRAPHAPARAGVRRRRGRAARRLRARRRRCAPGSSTPPSGAVLLDRAGSHGSGARVDRQAADRGRAALACARPTDRLTHRRRGPAPTARSCWSAAGDPTLTAAQPGEPGAYGPARPGSATSPRRCARHTCRSRRIVVDDGAVHRPGGVAGLAAPTTCPSDYGSAITAVMADGGRASPDAVVRSATPDLAAGRAFAAPARRAVGAGDRAGRAGGGQQLAAVSLGPARDAGRADAAGSDNVIAECLARQVALARAPAGRRSPGRRPRSPRSAATLGVDAGHGMVDGSGLAAARPAQPGRPRRACCGWSSRHVPAAARHRSTALPVAGWCGTLADRYVGRARAAAGAGRGAGQDRHADRCRPPWPGSSHDRDGAAARVRLHRRPARRDTDAAEAASTTWPVAWPLRLPLRVRRSSPRRVGVGSVAWRHGVAHRLGRRGAHGEAVQPGPAARVAGARPTPSSPSCTGPPRARPITSPS